MNLNQPQYKKAADKSPPPRFVPEDGGTKELGAAHMFYSLANPQNLVFKEEGTQLYMFISLVLPDSRKEQT